MSHLMLYVFVVLSACPHCIRHVDWIVPKMADRQTMVYVYACRYPNTRCSRWAHVYADKNLTQEMPNPFVPNRDGSFGFFTTKAYLDLEFSLPQRKGGTL